MRKFHGRSNNTKDIYQTMKGIVWPLHVGPAQTPMAGKSEWPAAYTTLGTSGNQVGVGVSISSKLMNFDIVVKSSLNLCGHIINSGVLAGKGWITVPRHDKPCMEGLVCPFRGKILANDGLCFRTACVTNIISRIG